MKFGAISNIVSLGSCEIGIISNIVSLGSHYVKFGAISNIVSLGFCHQSFHFVSGSSPQAKEQRALLHEDPPQGTFGQWDSGKNLGK